VYEVVRSRTKMFDGKDHVSVYEPLGEKVCSVLRNPMMFGNSSA
jgi:hypothetical protein